MRFIAASIIAAGLVAFSAPAQAALNSYLTLEGQTQGQIQGGVTQAGREGTIEIYGFSHEVISPRDAASGLPTGKRQHKPFSVTKALDKSTPRLLNAWSNNETIANFRLDMWRPSRAGKEFQYYTIELVNATIVSIALNAGAGRTDPHTETVSFAYEKIKVTWQDGGITAEDDWEAAAAPARLQLRRND